MLREFKDFFLRGNVIHLSVAVIIGTSFTALVTVVANSWIGPLMASFGGRNPNGLAVTLVTGNPRSVIDFGAILTALITFVIIATVVYYLIVLPTKEIQLRRLWAAKSRPPVPTEVQLLSEIRGLLQAQQGLNGSTPPAAGSAPLMVEVDQAFSSRVVSFPGDTPGLLIDYGGNQMAFAAGRGMAGVANAHEFAVGLAYTALAFASRCRIQMTPQHATPATPA